jgi:ATP-dependent Clp protease ATP-binding subunit ClpC
MEYALILLLAIAAALLAQKYRRSTHEKSAPAATTPPAEGPAPAPPPNLSARLHALAGEIIKQSDAIAHPRDVASLGEFREAVALLTQPEVSLDSVTQYATGANWALSSVALEALCTRPDREAALGSMLSGLRGISPWPLHFAFRYFCSLAARPPVGAIVLHAASWWSTHGLAADFLRDYFNARAQLGDGPDFGNTLDATSGWDPDDIATVLKGVDHPAASALLARLQHWRRHRLDREFLQSCGRLWEERENDAPIAFDALREPLADARTCIQRARPRSLLIVAEPRAGKTSFLRLLATILAPDGWSVFEAGAAELMAGQKYFGELEAHLKRLTAELAPEKRVLWYVPDFPQIVSSGTHTGQSASILDQILPAITSGRLVVAGEVTPAALTRMLQNRPALRTAFEVIRLRSLTDDEAVAVATRFVAGLRTLARLEVDGDVVMAGMQLARQYLAALHMPGAILDLLKLSANRAAASGETRLTRQGLLATLSQLTGLPQSILNDTERIALDSIRNYFGTRVIGQPEAVEAIVDRIAMLKAGLTDPGRPIAVFLFAGPTGTGKTELAKTLAAFLFGSVERMIRLDMSEFQTSESTRKILGEPGDGGDTQSLIARVRKQPFSVVLLDEFEKAHANVWDLFLQVFDDGRLTDAIGQTADFRHSIIILTSNLGATYHQGSGLGFTPQPTAFSQEQILRAVGQTFRPEFVNRLDKVIVFHPLSRSEMRRILHKELQLVLQRRGLRDREWAVEWEPSALEFLLDRGFSPEMGARPLKRAIDQHLLAPLAATIVEHRFPAGDQFLFVRSDGNGIHVEFLDPDAEAAPPPSAGEPAEATSHATLAAAILQPAGSSAEHDALAAASNSIDKCLDSPEWEALKQRLADDMQARDFWQRADRHGVLARYALMDRVKAAAVAASSLHERLTRSTTRNGRYSRELVSRLALQLYLIDLGIRDALSDAPVELVLAVQPAVDTTGDARVARTWSDQVTGMYRRWAAKRRMQLTEITGSRDGAGPLFVVFGFGAWRTLEGEVGLHVLEGDGSKDGLGRAVTRVRIASRPLGEWSPRAGSHESLSALLDKVPSSNNVVRRYRLDGSPLVRDARHGWRTGRVEAVLDGDFDLLGQLGSPPKMRVETSP